MLEDDTETAGSVSISSSSMIARASSMAFTRKARESCVLGGGSERTGGGGRLLRASKALPEQIREHRVRSAGGETGVEPSLVIVVAGQDELMVVLSVEGRMGSGSFCHNHTL